MSYLKPLPARLPIRLPALLLAGVFAAHCACAQQGASSASVQEQAGTARMTYSVVNLGAGTVVGTPAINRFGQVAYSLPNGAWFYDGTTPRSLSTFGVVAAIRANDVNDAGQVVGFARFGDNPTDIRAFRWSKRTGIVNLGALAGGTFSEALAINNHGTAAGDSQLTVAGVQTDHATRWPPDGRIEDLGSLGATTRSEAVAIGDTGLIAGDSVLAPFVVHAFAWTRETGLIDLGTLGGNNSTARAVGAKGEVAGTSEVRGSRMHAFLWTRAGGMRDLGTAGGTDSITLAMSPGAHVVGFITTAAGMDHAMSWTRSTGMKDLGTLGGRDSRALGVNDKGQVVGQSLTRHGQLHAFLWTAASGMIDLNKLATGLPKGVWLQSAMAISDNGSIVVSTNTGLVLLKPCGCHHAAGTPGDHGSAQPDAAAGPAG